MEGLGIQLPVAYVHAVTDRRFGEGGFVELRSQPLHKSLQNLRSDLKFGHRKGHINLHKRQATFL